MIPLHRSIFTASITLSVCALAAAGALSCSSGESGDNSKVPVVNPPDGTPPVPIDSLPEPTEPGGEAFVRIVECLSDGDIAKCEDDFVAEYAAEWGISTPTLLADMEAARKIDVSVENACHPIAHAIGRWTFEQTQSIADSFDVCGEECHSGCFHGVMERVFQGKTDHPTLDEVEAQMPLVCDKAQFADPSSAVMFQCYHGIGHAILFTLGYDLERGLDTCDLLNDDYGARVCRGAVFMENVTALDKSLRDVDPNDPHYPCSKVKPEFGAECYSMQTSLMFEFGHVDDEIAEICLGAGNNIPHCMTSLGRDLSNSARTGNPERLRSACEDHAGEYATNCVWGGIAALMDNTWDGRFSIPFCNEIKGEELKRYCYERTYSNLTVYYQMSAEDWTEQCSQHAGEGMDICLAQASAGK